MASIAQLFQQNKDWAAAIKAKDRTFFETLAQQQAPEYLWIGCADSRVPANEIIGLMPGEVFVHRNIANVVVHTDLNCLSVVQFAVEVLRVKHVLVVGHYGCGGVQAALQNRRIGLADNWLRHVQDVRHKHAARIDSFQEEDERAACLCELNVIEQVSNLCQTTVVQDAWDRGQELKIHGWVYKLQDGLIRDLKMAAASPTELVDSYAQAVPRTGRF